MTVEPPPSGRRLRRIRLSMRTMMLLVLAFGCWLGWYLLGVRSQQDSVAAIVNAGGSFDYDWKWARYIPDIVGESRVERWLATSVGVDYVADITNVSLFHRPLAGTVTANDETVRRLSRLSRLEFLGLVGTDVTDAGLAHVKPLTRLKELDLRKTQIGDAGLAHLKGMTNLRVLNIAYTRGTDDGALAIEESLPETQVIRDEDLLAARYFSRVAADFDFVRNQPVRLACRLLLHRARMLAARRDTSQFTESVHALCDLEAGDIYSLLTLAKIRADCLGVLELQWTPSLAASEREALQRRCADRAIAALSLAVDRGYNKLDRLEGDSRAVRMLGSLRGHPGFAEIVARIKAKRAAH